MLPSWKKPRSKTQTTATPSPAPTPPEESFIRKKFSIPHRDVKALAASSIPVASSIGSRFLSNDRTSYSEEERVTNTSRSDNATTDQKPGPHQAAVSAWQTAYSTAKMVVNITKESSDMFPPLKAVVGALSVLIQNYDRTTSNSRQIKEIEERALSLSDILGSPLRADDRSESARRELLRRRLVDVVVKLEPLSEQNGLLKFLRNENHAGLLNGFVQDIAHAVTDYQTSLQQSTYENTKDIQEVARGIAENTAGMIHEARGMIEAADLEVLDKLNPVHSAGYQAEHHEKCLSGTREPILREIMYWAKSAQDQPVFWLNGLAGTGKSTIAQTFSEMASNDDILGASFFCSRDYLERKMLKNIFPTLAYQLACRYPQFRNHLVKVIRRDPSVAHSSLISQLRDLLVDPLSAIGISCVIIIDALDECVDDQPASAILSVLGRLVSKLPLVKFFITGRPEPRIRSGFRLPLLEPFTQIFLLHEVASPSVEGDIRLYLTEKLTGIAKRRSDLDLPEAWPSDKDITALVQKSSGLFIFAVTVARFVESEHHEPRERLRLIVSKVDDTSYEGASGIDSLYSQVLRDAFSDIREEPVFVDLKRILSVVVLALDPLSRDGLVQLLDIDSGLVSARLRHLHSVMLVPADGSKEIRVFHKSFPDFLQDPKRCPDPRFHIDYSTRHGDMALSCLQLVGGLRMNPCSLAPFAMNQDVPNRSQLLKDKLGSGLLYACKYLSAHLLSSSTSAGCGNWLVTPTSLFLDNGVFPWMEVMSLEDRLEDVIHSMNRLSDWCRKGAGVRRSSLADQATDCLRFTLHFFRPIQMSAQHIYHTALPLSPETSILRRRFLRSHRSLEKDWTMRQATSSILSTTWGPVLRTIKADSGRFIHVVVAGQRIVAVCEDNTVSAYDAVTGVLRLSLNPPQQVTKVEGSPDGSFLFCVHQHSCEITLWDTQTGGMIHTFTTKSEIANIAVSSMGKYLASCSSNGTLGFWEVGNRRGGPLIWREPVECICWLEPEDQVALAVENTVAILEVTTGKKLRTFTVEGGSVRGIAFSAGQRRLVIWKTSEANSTFVVIDIQTGSPMVSSSPLLDVVSFTLSEGGDRVVCATKSGIVRHCSRMNTLSPTDWYDHLDHLGIIHSISLLRSGHLVANLGGSIQLLAMDYTRPPNAKKDLEMSHIYPLDNGRAISASSKDRNNVHLLDMETMKTLAHYPIRSGGHDVPFMPRTLCASIDRHITAFCFRKSDKFVLKLRATGSRAFGWETLFSRPVLSGALSPGGEKLITVLECNGLPGDLGWELCVQRSSDGRILASIRQAGRPPGNIVFTSETQFYTEVTHVRATPAPLPEPRNYAKLKENDRGHSVRTTFTLAPTTSKSYRIQEVSEEILNAPYTLDESLEWVVDAKLRRVCWLPPGYVSGIENGHFFVGSSIVMAGQDGIVRRLTFRDPYSES